MQSRARLSGQRTRTLRADVRPPRVGTRGPGDAKGLPSEHGQRCPLRHKHSRPLFPETRGLAAFFISLTFSHLTDTQIQTVPFSSELCDRKTRAPGLSREGGRGVARPEGKG